MTVSRAVDTRLGVGHSGPLMAENMQLNVRVDPRTLARVEGLTDHVRRERGYIATPTDALREVLVQGLRALEHELHTQPPERLVSKPLSGDSVQRMCRVDPEVAKRADEAASELERLMGHKVERASALREAIERGIALLERQRDGG